MLSFHCIYLRWFFTSKQVGTMLLMLKWEVERCAGDLWIRSPLLGDLFSFWADSTVDLGFASLYCSNTEVTTEAAVHVTIWWLSFWSHCLYLVWLCIKGCKHLTAIKCFSAVIIFSLQTFWTCNQLCCPRQICHLIRHKSFNLWRIEHSLGPTST